MTQILSELPDLLFGLSDQTSPRKAFMAGSQIVKYSAFRERVFRTRGLFRHLDLNIGDRLVIASSDEYSVAALYAACLLSGVTAVLIDPSTSAAEATVLVQKSRARVAFIDRVLLDNTEALRRADGPRVVAVNNAAPKKTTFGFLLKRERRSGCDDIYPGLLDTIDPVTEREDVPADCSALVLFTSGTTSSPKGVVMTHANLSAQLRTFRSHYGYDADSAIVNHLPLHHTDGLNQGPLLTLALGATWLRPAPISMQNLGELMDLIYRERATHLITVPTVLAMMTRLPDSYDDTFAAPEFRFISSTAGYLEERIWREVETRFDTMVVNSYGLTETVMEALYCGPTEETRSIGTIGKPIDCEARIVNDKEEDALPGETGELWLRGTNVMRGYLDDPDATREVLRDGWLLTGDLVVRDDEGFFRIVGRKKNIIIRGGINVSPEDVNSVLIGMPGVDSAATIGIRDVYLGEKVVSCVVARDDGPSVDALMEHCRKELAAEKVPNKIHIFEALPYGPSGKVELAKLRSLVEQREATTESSVDASQSPRERVLAIAAAVFQHPMDSLAPESTQETVKGWDSLSYLEMVMALERQFNFNLSPRDVMNIHRLGDAIRVVEARLAAVETDAGASM